MTLKVKLLDQTNFPNLKQNPNSRDKRETTPQIWFYVWINSPKGSKTGYDTEQGHGWEKAEVWQEIWDKSFFNVCVYIYIFFGYN